MEHLVAAVEEEEAAAAAASAIAASASAAAKSSVRHAPTQQAPFERSDEPPTAMDVDDGGAQAMDEDDPASSDEGEDFSAQGDEARGQQVLHRFAPQDPQANGPRGPDPRASPASSSDAFPTWQSMFRQLRDFHALGHRHFPPRMALWMNSQRRRYKRYGLGLVQPTGILVNRIRQLNSLGFDWHAPPYQPDEDSESASVEESEDETSDDESARPGRGRPKLRGREVREHDPGAKNWTPEEDEVIDSMQAEHGNKWSIIAAELGTGRTSDEIKNRWGWMYRRGLVGGENAPKSSKSNAGPVGGGTDAGFRTLQRQDSGDRLGSDRRPYGRHVEGMVKAALEEERQATLAKKYGRSSRARRAASRRGAESTDDSDMSVGGHSTGGRRGSGYESVRSDVVAGGGGKKKNVKTAFPALLYDMVTDCTENEPHICEWTDEGDAFAIKAAGLMPPAIGRYFNHSNYRSLQRMMYHYNFKRCSDEYDGVYYHPNFNRWSTKEELVNNVIKGGDAGELERKPRGRPKGSVGKKKREKQESKREKQFERYGEGAAHPGLLFADEDEDEDKDEDNEEEDKDNEDEASAEETRVTTPGPSDVALSLAFPLYKKIMFARFQKVGRKLTEGDDKEEMKELAQAIHERIRRTTRKSAGGGGKGRLLKAVKGKAWYEVVDEEWALEKIGNDLRRRMESSHQWLNKAPIVDDEDPMDLEREGGEPGKSDDLAVAAANDGQDAGAKESGATSHDLVVSLEAPAYRAAMVARFQALGEKADEDDPERIKAIGKETFDGFKKELGETGRFLRRAEGAGGDEAPLEAIDDEAVLAVIEQDLRRRMESSKSWLNVNLDALPKEGAEPQPEPLASVQPDAVGSADVVMANAPDSPTSVQSPAPPNWNLGSVSSPGVTYYKSNIGKYWVEQVVPRKTVRDRGPSVDRYYLSPDGRRFRSMAEVMRFLEETGHAKAESGEEEEESNESAVSYESEEDDEGGRRTPVPMPCNCKKSKCLKLYCDCFNKERYCAGCSCLGCRNTPVYDAQRDRAIADILDKNPDAFKHGSEGVVCKCRRTGCLKKYCECFARGKYCGDTCRCRDCENFPLESLEEEGEVESIEDGVEDEEEDQQDGRISSFAGTLHELVSHVNDEDPSVISWTPDGAAFFVHDGSQERLGKYLEMFFRHNNYSSLQRQLINYGFQRHMEGRLVGAYFHEHFHRDVESMDELNYNIRRMAAESGYVKKAGSSRKRRAVSDPYARPYKVHAPTPRAATSQVGGNTIAMKCPHCLEMKTFSNPMTAAASFSNHVRACGQKAGATEAKKSKMRTCPHCKRDFNFAGYTNHVRACEQEKKKSSSMRTCPHCKRDFHLAGYTNHVRACEQEKKKSTMRTCPHCNRDFNFAGYTNHVRACEQETKKSSMRTCPHCKRDFHLAGYTNHVRACEQEKKKSTIRTCPHCNRDFNFAGYTNHVRACGQNQGMKPKTPSPESATYARGKVTLHCPHCLETKYFQAGTAAASFSNHVRACSKKHGVDPDKAVAESAAAKKPVEPRKPSPTAKLYQPRRQCPHCLETKYFPNPMTGPASFNNHMRACGKKKEAREEAAAKAKTPAPPKPAEGGVTMKCPHCSEDKHFSNPGTAAASFSHHVTACAKRKAARDKADGE